jgi:hypothetical protein
VKVSEHASSTFSAEEEDKQETRIKEAIGSASNKVLQKILNRLHKKNSMV